MAEQVSQTAIEQILGRVLRMPKAKRKQRDALTPPMGLASVAIKEPPNSDAAIGDVRHLDYR
ncbi:MULTISPECIES: hypothetical protein [unclassified Sphingopyxis]|uniref:hypothetical protein n=1 Tax=unclassified Sphingopyxis TaxID=2614943 RepID=UPI000A4FF0FF|nr:MULTISPECIES: hypothetical protein [unclassified Sphingopyxis]